MKNAKILYLALSVIAAGAFSSCTNEDDLGGASSASVELVYFPTTNATSYTLEKTTTSVSIPVKRGGNTDAEYTVNILADFGDMTEADQGLFTVPSSVKFDAGKNESSITVGVNMSGVEEGKEYTIGFLLNDEENTSPYGNSSLYVTLASWPWTELGTGKYRDDWFTALWNVENVEIDVTIHESKTTKGLYMIENMYGWTFLEAAFEGSQEEITGAGYVVSYTPSNIIINCSDPAKVTIPLQATGIEDGSSNALGNIHIGSMSPGTLENGIITFPANGLFLGNSAGTGAYANSSGLFRIVLPSYEAFDYSLTATYSGMRVGSDNETASAVVDFTYGADVTGISYVFANGNVTFDPSSYVSAIVSGSAENIFQVEDFVAGGESVSIEAELTAGVYTIIAVPADKTGALSADNATAMSFYFPGVGGSSTPECNATVNLYKVSDYEDAAGYVAQCPDYSSFVYEVTGSDIKSVKYYINTTDIIGTLTTDEEKLEVINTYGTDMTQEALAELTSTGKYWNIFINREANTSYTMLIYAENNYGRTSVVTSDPIVTDQIPYSGSLRIGDYTMSCTVSGDGDDPFVSSTVLRLDPTLNSTTAFTVSNLFSDDGLKWNAVYDPDASTLTLNGTSPSLNNPENNAFGGWIGLTTTTAIMYFTYTDPATSNGNEPLVFTVADNMLSGLNSSLQIAVGSISDNGVTPRGAIAQYDAGTTSVVYGNGESSSASTGMFSSQSAIYKGMRNLTSRVGLGMSDEMQLKRKTCQGIYTLPVKTGVCEPLPKNDGHFRINADVRACDFIVK